LKTTTDLLKIKSVDLLTEQICHQQSSPTRPEMVVIAARQADVGFIA